MPRKTENTKKSTSATSSSRNGRGSKKTDNRSSKTKGSLTREDIQRRAWEIWQSEGCPEGRALEHWLQAEEELRS